MTNDLVVTALERAYSSQKPNKSIIFHTDLGSQYTSNDMKNLCKKLNITQSFSKKGCPYDNACIELDLCQYSRHIFLVFLSRFCNKIFIILWSHITNSAMNSFSVIPTFNILKY